MSHCPVCDGDDYEEVDGLFYCVICNTQSQTLRTEEAPEPVVTRGLSLREAKSYTHPVGKEGEDSIQWQTEDAFHIILRHQADALIAKGATTKIKDVLLRIWKLYLAKTGLACTREGDDVELLQSVANAVPRNRDELSDFRDDETKKTSRRRANESASYVEDGAVSEADADQEAIDSPPHIHRTTYFAAKREVGRMRLSLTVSMCHIALQYINNQVTSWDLYRWIINGSLPYRNSEDLLPANMLLNTSDRCIFTSSTVPKPSIIVRHSGQLVRYLELEDFPVVNLRPLAVRFIRSLHLPGEIHGMVQRLLYSQGQEYFSGEKWNSLYVLHPLELIVMAHILVVLKMLFVMDDSTEWKISQYAKDLNTAVPELELFVFEDWVSWMSRGSETTKLPYNPRHARKIADIKILDEVPCPEADKFDRKTAKTDSFMNKATRHFLERSIKTLKESYPDRSPVTNNDAEEDSSLSGLLRTFDTLDADSIDLDYDISSGNGDFHAKKTFMNTSVSYLTNSHGFEKYLSKVRRRQAMSAEDGAWASNFPEFQSFQTATNYIITETSHERNSKSYRQCADIAAKLISFSPEEVNSWVYRLERVLFTEKPHVNFPGWK